MGRKKLLESQKKVKFSISIDREIYKEILSEDNKPSRIIESLLKKYYGK
jgi:hypothetical protein